LYYKLVKNSNFNHDQISRNLRQLSDHKVYAVKIYIFLIIHLWENHNPESGPMIVLTGTFYVR